MDSRTHNFINYCKLTDREVYDFYRENRARVAKGINDFNLFKKAVSGLFNLVRNIMKDSKGGIYIDGLGYFCHVITLNKYKFFRRDKSIIIRNRRHYVYKPYFFPDDNINRMEMIFNLKHTVKKYKLHFDICQTKQEAFKAYKKIHKEWFQ